MGKKKLLMVAVLCAINATGFAAVVETEQPPIPEYDLGTMVVTATRNLEDIKKVPASVSVITAQDIAKKNATTITDAINKTMGIYVERPKGLADTASGIEMRGFGESNLLVLYDGMPMNTAYDGGVNWSAIPIDNVERIEVVRGAASSLYGGRAVGGVINIITKRPTKELKISGTLLGGSNSTWRKSLHVSQQPTDKFGYKLGFEQRSTAGFENKVVSSTSSGSKNPTGTVGTGVVVGQKVDGKPRYIIGTQGKGAGRSTTYNGEFLYNFDKDKQLSYSYTHDEFRYWTGDPQTYIRDGAGNPLFEGSVQLPSGKWLNFDESDFTDYYGRRDTDVHSFKYRDEANKLTFNLGVSNVKDAGYSTGNYFDGSTPGNDTSYPSKSYKADFQKVWSDIGRHTIVAGVNAQRDEMTRTSKKLSAWHDWDSATATTSSIGGKDDVWAAFLQDEYKWTDKLSMHTGIRYDYYKKFDGYYNDVANGKYTKYADEKFTEWSPKLAFQYAADEQTSYYLSYGHSFNPPTLYKLYRTDSYYIGNPALKPESSDSFELGLNKQMDPKTDIHMAIYRTFTKDLIVAERIPDSSKRWYVNKDRATRSGFEAELKHKFDEKWTGYVNYQWQRVVDDEGEVIYGYPKHIMHTGVEYTSGKWNANLDAEYVSNRNDPGELSNVYLSYDSFVTFNTGVNYAFNKNLKAVFTVKNLLNREYYQWYKADGRTWYLGVQFDY